MQFLYPAFLWALTALAIPVILHLFYFRRYKKVYFSNLRFLREVKEETSARNRLRNLLILLARLLAMACIILAFAQPVIPLDDRLREGVRNVSLFIDNSFSMQSFGKDLSLFDRARQNARDVIHGYNVDDRFQILTHDLTMSESQWTGREEALLRLEEIEFTPTVSPLSVVYGRQKQAFARESGIPVAWIISDFQQSIFDLNLEDTLYPVQLLPLRGVREKNVGIDTAWFESPVHSLNQTSSLLFQLRNYAQEDADNIRVSIELDGQERPLSTLDLKAGELRTDTAHITVLTTGWHKVAIRISDFPVTFDDTYYLTFYVDEQINILTINEATENKHIHAIFSSRKNFTFDQTRANAISYSELGRYHLIILNEVTQLSSGLAASLRSYAEEGGKVLFVPAPASEISLYNTFLSTMGAGLFQQWEDRERQAGFINTDAFIFSDVFRTTRPNMRLPVVQGSYIGQGSGSQGQSLIRFRDGGDLLTFYPIGQGAFCQMMAPLTEKYNDLVQQPEIFVPLLFRLTLYTSELRQAAYTIGRDFLLPVDRKSFNPVQPFHLTGTTDFIPGVSAQGGKTLLDIQGQIRSAGYYDLYQADQKVASFAFNYDRRESDLSLANLEEMPDNGTVSIWDDQENTDFTRAIAGQREGKQLWRWCVILALLWIATEIALIRLWKP